MVELDSNIILKGKNINLAEIYKTQDQAAVTAATQLKAQSEVNKTNMEDHTVGLETVGKISQGLLTLPQGALNAQVVRDEIMAHSHVLPPSLVNRLLERIDADPNANDTKIRESLTQAMVAAQKPKDYYDKIVPDANTVLNAETAIRGQDTRDDTARRGQNMTSDTSRYLAEQKRRDERPANQKKQLVGIENTRSGIQAYRDRLKNFSPTDFISPDARAVMGTMYNNMMLQAKEAYNLGVLNGGDYRILQSVITDPTSAKAIILSKEALDEQASELDRMMAGMQGVTGGNLNAPKQGDQSGSRQDLSKKHGMTPEQDSEILQYLPKKKGITPEQHSESRQYLPKKHRITPEQVVSGLVSRGYARHEAAGIAGNLAQESGFDTAIQEVNPQAESARRQGGGVGLAQWTSKERKQGLYNMAEIRGVPVDDLDLQLDYLDHELKTTHKKAYKALKSTRDARHAAWVFSKYYEVPSEKHANNSNRMGLAEQFINLTNPISSAQGDETPWQEPVDESAYLATADEADYEAADEADYEAADEADYEAAYLATAKKLGFIKEPPSIDEAADEADYEAAYLATAKKLGFIKNEPTAGQKVGQVITDIGGGALKGASNIGNTLISAADTYNDFLGNKYSLTNQIAGEDDKYYGERSDGTKKGSGFLGELPMKNGDVATELTIGVNIDGKETNIPAIVPTLSKEQLQYIQNGGEINQRKDIIDAAKSYATERLRKGLSPYANDSQTASEKRRQQATEDLKDMGVNTDSFAYNGGELAAEIVGPAKAAKVLSGLTGGAKAIPALSKFAPALGNIGMKVGTALQRIAGGAVTAGASSALIDPETADTGAVLGAALPAGKAAIQVLGKVRKALKGKDFIPQANKDAAAKAIRQGLKIPPSQVNPTYTNKIIEGTGVKKIIAQNASAENQGIFNLFAKQDIPVRYAKNVKSLNAKGLEAVKKKANKDYDKLGDYGKIESDDMFMEALDAASARTQKFKEDFPGMKNLELDELVASLKEKSKLNSDTTLEAIKRLKKHSFLNKKSQYGEKNELGEAQAKIATALEDLFERNVEKSGDKILLEDFRVARATLEKTHIIRRVVDISTGNINGNKLARELQKGNLKDGKLKDIAEFAQAFPAAAQNISKMGSLVQTLPQDLSIAGTLSLWNQDPNYMALMALRPAARKLALSKYVQSRLIEAPSKALEKTEKALRLAIPAAAQVLGRD